MSDPFPTEQANILRGIDRFNRFWERHWWRVIIAAGVLWLIWTLARWWVIAAALFFIVYAIWWETQYHPWWAALSDLMRAIWRGVLDAMARRGLDKIFGAKRAAEPLHPDRVYYREQYAALAALPANQRTQQQELHMVSLRAGLIAFGDQPEAFEPRPQVRGLLGAHSAVGAALGPWSLALRFWWVAPAAFVLGLLGFKWAAVERLKAERDAECRPRELAGHTTRAACVALAQQRDVNEALREQMSVLRARADEAAQDAERSAQESLALANHIRRVRDRESQLRQRARNAELESVRSGAEPDWRSELSEFAPGGGATADRDGAAETGAADAPGTGGMPPARDAASDLHPDHPSASAG